MPTTSNFGWTTPADTDLVKDGAAAIRTLGNGIDTSFLDLKGGTTGQNLRKASNTDLDFTFAGDATNTVIDAEGDLLVGDSADTLQRLAIGTTGQVLTVDTTLDGKVKWASPAGGGKVLQVVQATTTTSTTIASTSYTDTTLTASITPSAATSKILIMYAQQIYHSRATTDSGAGIKLLRGATDIYTPSANGYEATYGGFSGTTSADIYAIVSGVYLDSPNTTSSTTYKTQGRILTTANSGSSTWQKNSSTSTIILMEIGA